tara:strand:+ start:626 stop:790 length:165 start_codon:yes stop_codon:yes gene_type:complete
MKLTNILTENYGGKGEMVLPPSHKAGLKVPKGGIDNIKNYILAIDKVIDIAPNK